MGIRAAASREVDDRPQEQQVDERRKRNDVDEVEVREHRARPGDQEQKGAREPEKPKNLVEPAVASAEPTLENEERGCKQARSNRDYQQPRSSRATLDRRCSLHSRLTGHEQSSKWAQPIWPLERGVSRQATSATSTLKGAHEPVHESLCTFLPLIDQSLGSPGPDPSCGGVLGHVVPMPWRVPGVDGLNPPAVVL